MSTQTWIPDGITLDQPNPAHIYGYNTHHSGQVTGSRRVHRGHEYIGQ